MNVNMKENSNSEDIEVMELHLDDTTPEHLKKKCDELAFELGLGFERYKSLNTPNLQKMYKAQDEPINKISNLSNENVKEDTSLSEDIESLITRIEKYSTYIEHPETKKYYINQLQKMLEFTRLYESNEKLLCEKKQMIHNQKFDKTGKIHPHWFVKNLYEENIKNPAPKNAQPLTDNETDIIQHEMSKVQNQLVDN